MHPKHLREKNRFENHFSKKKGYNIRQKWKYFRNEYYFDVETFELYSKPDQEEPFIVCYNIGFWDDRKGSYTAYFGERATEEFLEDFLNQKDVGNSRLSAFNIDYDFQSIRPLLEIELWKKNLHLQYQMTDTKKFLFGDLKNKTAKTKTDPHRTAELDAAPLRSIRFNDLWMWDRSKSLDGYIEYIKELIWDKKGNQHDTETARELLATLIRVGLHKDSFKKLKIDYKKINLHKRGDDWYYWRSKQDWIDDKEPAKLDVEQEAKYLEVDVRSLPVVHKEISLFKKTIQEVLGIPELIDEDHSITLPGFAKFIFEEYLKKWLQETYRAPTEVTDYQAQELSYTGAFTASNKNILYLDEEVFKQMYPGKSFYDEEGNYLIKCYDVNSLYPSVMVTGLPVGMAFEISNPEEIWDEYITWYEITFTKMWDDKNWYVWKPEYNCLNNSFFGDNFLVSYHKHGTQKYVWKPLFEKFLEMCDSHVEVVGVRYQEVSYEMNDFIYKLYEVKKNNAHLDPITGKPKKNDDGTDMKPLYNSAQRSCVKLLLNSLYGKLGERFKTNNCIWTNDLDNKIKMLFKKYPEIYNEYKLPEGSHKYKLKFPYRSLKFNAGFVISPNIKKTRDACNNEVRESILAGLYVTQRSRWLLMTALKGEIDQGNVILNCDTDSLKIIQFKPPKFVIDNYELGAWKFEGDFSHFQHPDRLKKYWVGNERTGDIKVACGGVPEKYIYDGSSGESFKEVVERLKVIYDTKNTVLIRNCKPNTKRNKSWQILINHSDYVFRGDGIKPVPTHEVVNKKVYEVSK